MQEINKNIEVLFRQLPDKKEAIHFLSEHFKVRPFTVRSNWFSNYWAVPQKHEEEVIKILQNFIKNQYTYESK